MIVMMHYWGAAMGRFQYSVCLSHSLYSILDYSESRTLIQPRPDNMNPARPRTTHPFLESDDETLYHYTHLIVVDINKL